MLLGSTILEVAIGLVFVYLLLSLICSAVNEWIVGLLSLRAQFLRKGVENLLADPVLKGLADQFFAHDHPEPRGGGPVAPQWRLHRCGSDRPKQFARELQHDANGSADDRFQAPR